MDLSLKAPVIALESGQVLSLDDAEGASIKARCGTLWITQEDDPEDIVLRQGERFVVDQPGRTVIQAFDRAWVSIREPDGFHYH